MNNPNNRFANVSVLTQQTNSANGNQQGQQHPGSMGSHGQMQSAPLQQQSGSLGLPPQFNSTMVGSQQYNSFPGSAVGTEGSTRKDPSWFNNPTKRAIPQTIMKRSNRSQDNNADIPTSQSSTALSTRSGFDTTSFGSRKNQSMLNMGKMATLNSDNILGDANEAPPSLSIHDWQHEDMFNTVPTLAGDQTNGEIGQGLSLNGLATPNNVATPVPSLFKNSNAFDKGRTSAGTGLAATPDNKNTNTIISDNSSNTNSAGGKLFDFLGSSAASNKDTLSRENNISSQEPERETGVIVFGYPESISNLVLTHFSHFGTILEDFEVLRSASGINVSTLKSNKTQIQQPKSYPIFTGEGWVKITYDNNQSAIRALQENGSVFRGSLLGCVPYSKNSVEKLASCRIDKNDNIGESDLGLSSKVTPLRDFTTGNFGFDNKENNNIPSLKTDSQGNSTEGGVSNNLQSVPQNIFFPNHRLTINDGKSLFVHNADANNHNFIQGLEKRMRGEELTDQKDNKGKNNGGIMNSVNNWLFGWNNL